jgi:uncharacterized protein (TIGR03437 family)
LRYNTTIMGYLIRPGSLAVTLYVLLGFSVASGQPAWYSQPQLFKYAASYQTSDPLIYQVPFTGMGWGYLYVPTVSQLDAGVYADPASLAQESAEAKAWNFGGPYFASTNLHSMSAAPPSWDSFRMRTLNGAYIDQNNVSQALPLYSLSSPIFQSYLEAQAKRAVDIGADGLLIDDAGGQLAVMLVPSAQNAGSFDSATMAAFQIYLQQKYGPAALQSQFGIADIGSFDFANYIQAKGLATTWNQPPLSGLPLEFFLFKRQETVTFLNDLVSSTKQYAKQSYNREFLFTCNCDSVPGALGYFARDAMDLTSNESYYIQGAAIPFMAPYIKAGKGWKSEQVVLAETGPPGTPGFLTKPTVNLMRVILADIGAAGGVPLMEDQMNVWFAPEPVDLSIVRRYANFASANSQFLRQTTTQARIALVESAPSVMWGVIYPSVATPWDGPQNYIGTARLLLDTGFTYDSSFFPDSTYSTLTSPQASELARYDIVIAPSVFALDDNQTATLLAYAKAGGTLIIDGDFATNEPSGAAASHPELGPILASPGETSYGSGKVVFSAELFGVEYQATSGGTLVGVDNAAQREARASFQAFMTPYIQPEVQVVQPPAQIYEPGITPFLYHDRTGNALVHLVNYDYDLASDQFYTKTNIQVSVQVGSQAVDDVISRSPDFTGAQSLPFTRSGGTITVTVPEVQAWVILYFQQNALAPVINSVSPTTSLGAVGGSSLSFAISASDPDGDPLTYTWSVNGTVVTDVFGPAYSLQLPSSASGTYTVTVKVTDGSRITETSWTINVAAYRAPRFLFDETHAERNTMNAARAGQLNPQHPTWVLFSILEQALAPDYQVTDLLTGTAGSLTPQVLSATDVLVLAAPNTPLTAAENQAVANFVQSGGGLIFLGDDGLNTSINTLIGPWGIQFNSALIESPQASEYPGSFYLSSFANNPALGSNPSFYTNYGGSLTISQGGIALGQTSAAEWESISGVATQQSGDPNGPFVMVGAAQFGSGRVFVVSDNAFEDNYSSFTGNLNLFLSGLAWVSKSVNATPAPLPASTAFVKTVTNGGSFEPAISPGSWATVFGSNLANTPPTGQGWNASDFQGNLLPTTLNGTSVLINGRPAAVSFISPGQLYVQAPDETTQGTVAVQVISPFGIAQGTATLASIAPSIFPVVFDGVVYAVAVAIDGARLVAPGQIPGSRAANPGETVEIFGTGFGATVPPQPAGQLVPASSPLANAVTASICGKPATVPYAGLVEVGVNQFNVVVPDSASGNCTVVLTVAGQSTQSGVVVPVAN